MATRRAASTTLSQARHTTTAVSSGPRAASSRSARQTGPHSRLCAPSTPPTAPETQRFDLRSTRTLHVPLLNTHPHQRQRRSASSLARAAPTVQCVRTKTTETRRPATRLPPGGQSRKLCCAARPQRRGVAQAKRATFADITLQFLSFSCS